VLCHAHLKGALMTVGSRTTGLLLLVVMVSLIGLTVGATQMRAHRFIKPTSFEFLMLGQSGVLSQQQGVGGHNVFLRVDELDVSLVDVNRELGAVLKFDGQESDDDSLFTSQGLHDTKTLKIGESVEFRFYRITLKSVSKHLLPVGSMTACVVVDEATPADEKFSKLRTGSGGSLLHPKRDAQWRGVAVSGPTTVETDGALSNGDAFYGVAPASAKVMIAGRWSLSARDARFILKDAPASQRIQDMAVLFIGGPTATTRREIEIEKRIKHVGERPPDSFKRDEDYFGDDIDPFSPAFSGAFAFDIGDEIAPTPNAQGTFRIWAEIGQYKTQELKIALKPKNVK